MAISKETMITKANVSVRQLADEAGYLFPEQAREFVELAIPQTAILNQVPIIPMRAPERHIEKFRFASRVLRAGSTETALTVDERATPQMSKQVLKAKILKAEIDVPDETLEDNIEKEGFMSSLLRAVAPRIGLDWEEVGINGDLNNAVDPFLAQFDGILKQASTIQYDHTGDVPNQDLWHKMIKLMPVEFQRMLPGMSFYTAFNVQHDWRANLAGRVGALGDAALQSLGSMRAFGIPVVPVANMREDDLFGGSANHSRVMLTHPQNVAVGLHAGIRVALDYDVRAGIWILVIKMRTDWKLIERTAVVRGQNVLSGDTSNSVGGSSTAQLVQDDPTALSELGFTVVDTSLGNDDALSSFVPPTDLGLTAPSFFP